MKKLLMLVLILGTFAFCDGWSESGLEQPVFVETITTKDDNSVLVRLVGVGKVFYFNNKPQMLSNLLTAKSTSTKIRVWSTTNPVDYTVSDLPPGGISKAHYLGAVQLQ